jgi:hypothetical protein
MILVEQVKQVEDCHTQANVIFTIRIDAVSQVVATRGRVTLFAIEPSHDHFKHLLAKK